jgi:hypothetical protein
MVRRRTALVAVAVVAVAATVLLPATFRWHVLWHHHSCLPPAGGRCPGPERIYSLHLDRTGRVLSGTFACGGRLTADESTSDVVVTYFASAVGAGAMSCAEVVLRVRLATPLAGRRLTDGSTHRLIQLVPAAP